MPDRHDLSDLDLRNGEFSICFEDLGGPANEDCTIEFVKSKTGLAPDLKETDMSDHNDENLEGEGDAEFEQFANEIIEEFNGLSEEDQVEALVGMALENAVQEEALEDATEVIKAMTEAGEEREAKLESVIKTLKQSGELIEKMKSTGNAGLDDGGLVAEIRKANGGADLSPEAEARLVELEKANTEAAIEKAVTKAKTYGFGDPKIVATLETSIRKSLGNEKADQFVAIVKQAGGLAKNHPVFKSIGEDAGADAGDAISKVNAAASEIRKSSKLTEAQAIDKALEDNPELYTEYMAQRRRA